MRTSRPALIAALAAYLVLSGLIAWQATVLAPYSDILDWFVRWETWRADGDLAGFLFAPHNFNRLAGTFSILALDIAGFGGRNLLFPLVGLVSVAAAATILAFEAHRAAPERLKLAAAVLAAMLALMAGNLLDAAIHINVQYVQVLALAAAAIVLGSRASPLAAAGAIGCAIAAAFCSAAGFAIWPGLVLIAWKGRQWRRLAVILVVGLAFSAAYAWGQTAPGGRGFDPAAAASLLLHYLGLPWTRAFPPAGAALGGLLLALGVAAMALRGREPRERAAVGLIAFSLCTAVLTALARTGYEASGDTPIRYAPFLTPLHAGLLILALPWLDRLPRAWAPAAAGLLVLQQAAMGYAAVRTTEVNRQMIADFLAGQRRPEMSRTIHPDLAHARAVYGRMMARGLYTHSLQAGKAKP